MRQPDEALLVDMLVYARQARDLVVGVSREEFDDDYTLQLALTHLIQIIGGAASRTDDVLRARYPDVPWHDIIGMRHRIVHDCPRVSMDTVWRTAQQSLPALIVILENDLRDM